MAGGPDDTGEMKDKDQQDENGHDADRDHAHPVPRSCGRVEPAGVVGLRMGRQFGQRWFLLESSVAGDREADAGERDDGGVAGEHGDAGPRGQQVGERGAHDGLPR